jgi:CheY-like chemotaxis protein
MLELLKVSISKRAVLQTDLQKGLPTVRASAPRIGQIVMNLIINASEAIGDQDGVIYITTSRVTKGLDFVSDSTTNLSEGDYLRLEVSDNGCGMTEAAKARIFDPFFTTKFAGRGMGLAVVQGVVRDHDGAINLVSRPGRGTTFEILLPCSGETVQSSSDVIARVSGQNPGPPSGTVLIVEDEDVLRRAVSKMLHNKGFRVIEASDGSSALELIRSHNDDINVMLLDMTLPGVPSREVFEGARHIRPKLKVILTSAYSRETVDSSFAGLPVERFIRKPFRFADLMSLLQDAMSA